MLKSLPTLCLKTDSIKQNPFFYPMWKSNILHHYCKNHPTKQPTDRQTSPENPQDYLLIVDPFCVCSRQVSLGKRNLLWWLKRLPRYYWTNKNSSDFSVSSERSEEWRNYRRLQTHEHCTVHRALGEDGPWCLLRDLLCACLCHWSPTIPMLHTHTQRHTHTSDATTDGSPSHTA